MTTNPTITRRRQLVLICFAAVIVVFLIIGGYGLLAGPRTPNTRPTSPGTPHEPSMPTATPSGLPSVPAVMATSDGETFARSVAQRLFTWDTSSGLFPLDYTAPILAVGDPTGTEQAGLANDVAAYLPTREQWVELRNHTTRQHVDIHTVTVPAAWADAQDQAPPGTLSPGSIAYTITATRHRAGTWNHQPVTSQHNVEFTMFIVCPPNGSNCHLLRLSRLGEALH